MCQTRYSSKLPLALWPLLWWHSVVSGWARGSLQGATRYASLTFPEQSLKLRSQLLTDTIKSLKLNENALPPHKKPAVDNVRWLRG
jgi:hypothetical protein